MNAADGYFSRRALSNLLTSQPPVRLSARNKSEEQWTRHPIPYSVVALFGIR